MAPLFRADQVGSLLQLRAQNNITASYDSIITSADGVDPDALLEQYIRVHNACLADRPADLHVDIHLCRGNMWSGVARRGIGTGSYERIAERLFNGTRL